MNPLVVLNLGNGDWHHGCPNVVAQLWPSAHSAPMQWTGALPPMPALGQQMTAWRSSYQALYAHLGWRKTAPTFEIDEDDITHVSTAEFDQLCRQICDSLNRWLSSEPFRSIDQALRTHLAPTNEIRLIITAQDREVLRLPWHLWRFFDDYPQAEPALSLPSYGRAVKSSDPRSTVQILVVLGNAEGINVERDRTLLEQLPQTAVTVLVEPDRATLNQHLWENTWDLLFFAGHSSTRFDDQSCQGCLQLNRSERLTLDDLRYGLRRAIAHGLKLAIFNSCDGLGLAWDLADLHIPQVIVMREPVPDRVAQAFLQSFLNAFAGQQSLYQSVRLAREQLQGLEGDFPCATWLPVIYQNPAEALSPWHGWRSPDAVSFPPTIAPRQTSSPETTSPVTVHRSTLKAASLAKGVLTSLTVTGLVLGVRALSLLQPVELWAFDRLQSLRPAEGVDDRFLVVTLTEADIQSQPQYERVGSLTDPALEQVLQTLERYQPRVIGLDLYRDRATDPQMAGLRQALQQNDRLVAVCKSRDALLDPVGIAPPPEVPPAQVGFSDFIEDVDGVLRRQLVSMAPDPASPCTTPYSFSARLAFRYLEAEGINPRFTPEGNLQLGDKEFRRLRSRWGGYQGIDAAGNQLMLNYRSLPAAHAIAAQVTLSQLLAGQVAPESIRDRIVILGVTASSAGDYWLTPFGSSRADRVAGVFVQTHMTSQLLSAVLDQRPMLWVWPLWGEALWLVAWGLAGYGIVKVQRLPFRYIGLILALGLLTGGSYVILLKGGWVPLVPAALAFALAGTIAYIDRQNLSQSNERL